MTAELNNLSAPRSNPAPGPLAAQEILGNRAVSGLVHISGTAIQIDKDDNIAVGGKAKSPWAGTGQPQHRVGSNDTAGE
jgi:hypothetical protein